MPIESTPPYEDAERWLAALEARVEDDEALLDQLTDREVAALLNHEDVRVSGVAASIRRRLRETITQKQKSPYGTNVFVVSEGSVLVAWLLSNRYHVRFWHWLRRTVSKALGRSRQR